MTCISVRLAYSTVTS